MAKKKKQRNPLFETLEAYQKRDPAARSKLEVLFLYQGVHATINHWVAHWCYRHKLLFLSRLISQFSRFWTGIEIHPGAKIGRRFVIDHGMGIVIGETAEIGDDVLLYHGVTLGGTGKDQGKRHPTIGNNVLIGCGAKILGPFTVEDGARIAANSVVLQQVPASATAVGIPAQIVKVAGKSVNFTENMDQVSVGDPRTETILAMKKRIDTLESLVEQLLEADSLPSCEVLENVNPLFPDEEGNASDSEEEINP